MSHGGVVLMRFVLKRCEVLVLNGLIAHVNTCVRGRLHGVLCDFSRDMLLLLLMIVVQQLLLNRTNSFSLAFTCQIKFVIAVLVSF